VTGRVVSPRLAGYLAVAVGLMSAGAVSGRGAFIALGAPFALVAIVGTALRPGGAAASATVDRTSVEAGGEVTVSIAVRGRPGRVAELALVVPAGTVAVGGNTRRVRLDRDGRHEEPVRIRTEARGTYRLGLGVVRVADPLGLVATDRLIDGQGAVRARPAPEPVRTPVRPERLAVASGTHPARVIGPGTEFAGLRPYQAGDRPRDLSWRASARRDALMVAQRHPERGADVVVFIDTFAAEGLEQTIRAGLSVSRLQLAERDRVGFVAFGGSIRTIPPGSGRRQLDLMAEALVDVQPVFSWAEKEIRGIPPRVLPPGSTILAVSPLIDERAIGAIVDLRRRRHEIGVIEISPESWAPAPDPRDETAMIARRLWAMQRAVRRTRLAAAGVPVVEWLEGDPLEPVLRQLDARRRGRGRWRAS
jgi:uncharacterized protein (DUF58 family)